MPLNQSSMHSLRRVFRQGFVTHDIAEPLVSFDDGAATGYVRDFMESHRFEVVGIRSEGRIDGYVELSSLGGGVCGDCMRPFDDAQVILESTPLDELILHLRDQRCLFVSVLGQVGGIVSRTDLQKPPVRMWLFGMVTLIEMRFSAMIERYCPDEAWREFLSVGRLEKAQQLLIERTRRDQDLQLLDCLQLSDKTQIIAKNKLLRDLTRFQSRRQMEDAVKMLEKLRNNLAHSQDIIANDWDTIVALSERLDAVLEGPPGMKREEKQKESD